MRTAIQNGNLILPDGSIRRGSVEIEGPVISGILFDASHSKYDLVIDAEGRYVSPGFIDIHTHGAGGADFMDGTPEAFCTAAMEHLRHGTTSLAPTTLTCTWEELDRSFVCFEAAKETLRGSGPNLIGMHLEGPFFSASQAGAQDPKYLQLPTKENIWKILKHEKDIVRVSAAVELPGCMELGDELKKRGILAAIGHSNAEYENVSESVRHGFTHVTHLYSGMSMLHRIGPYRHLGVVESAYLLDELTVEIIADGKHLPPELLRYILKFIPVERISLITDSTRGAGLPEGSIVKLGSLDKGQDVIIEDSVAMLMDHTAFGGSVCTADRCVRTMYQLAGASLSDAVRMMTRNPAELMKLSNKGSIGIGKHADLCIFDEEIQVKSVFVMGKKAI